ncbi:MAG: hypothetical protein ABWY93_13495 [Mycobacterium sp.]
MSKVRGLLAALAGIAIVAAAIVGCSETVTGTPQADPAQTGQPLSPETTTSRSTTRTSTTTSTLIPTRTAGPPSGTPGAAPAGADTTCGDYNEMADADKQAVIEAIGKDNAMVQQGEPEMWISVADMLCVIAQPTAYVRDVVMGKM